MNDITVKKASKGTYKARIRDYKPIIQRVYDFYQESLLKILAYDEGLSDLSHPTIVRLQIAIDRVDSIVENLGNDARRIIAIEIKGNYDPHWYSDFYSKSAYNRIKAKAYAEFIEKLKL